KRQRVAIDDRDPQESSSGWLERRPALFPPIALWGGKRKDAKALDLQWCVVATLAEQKAVRQGTLPIGIVAMRVDARTHSAEELDAFLAGFDMPVVAHLRQTQVYVQCARDGASVFDLPRSRAEQDWEQWKSLTRWIATHAP